MAEADKSLGSVRFGPFELALDTQELRKHGVPLKLSGQAIQVLAMLTANPGKLVTREELQQKLWPGAPYGDPNHGLNAAVNKLRETLGDSSATPTYIETLSGRGYRLIAKIDSGEPEPAPDPEPSKPRRKWKAALIALALILVAAALLYPKIKTSVDRQLRIAQLQRMKVVPLTSLPGSVRYPTFSPDGSQVAFGWKPENNTAGFDLFVKVIGNEKPLRLTNGGAVFGTAWSPDGQSIAVSGSIGRDDFGIYLVSPLGGRERKVTSRRGRIFYGIGLSWSPDGKQLAFLDDPANADSIQLFVVSLSSLERILVKTDCNFVAAPVFSPNGEYLAWVCVDNWSSNSLHVQRVSDGHTTELLRGADGIDGIAWSRDGRRIVFSSPFKFGYLWEISLERPGVVEKLPIGHDAFDLAVSPTGNRLAYTQIRTNVNIWRLDLEELQPRARKVVTSSREQTAPNISPDGNRPQ
jgi:Tol biopolymer transport system component